MLNCYVSVTAEWIFLCGRILFDSNKDYRVASGGGRLWKGTGGFSREWWQFWKQRFGAISEHGQVSERTKQVARAANDMMTKIENESRESGLEICFELLDLHTCSHLRSQRDTMSFETLAFL